MRPVINAILWSLMYKRALSFTGSLGRPFRSSLLARAILFSETNRRHQPPAAASPPRLPLITQTCRWLSPSSIVINARDSSEKVVKTFHDTLYNEILPKVSPPGNGNGQQYMCLIGVSGGCDSIALFHLMRQLHDNPSPGQRNYFRIHVVHFDHQQRGVSSDKDRKLVDELCVAHQIPLTCYYWDDYHLPGDGSYSFSQASAREWRQTTMRKLLHTLLQENSCDSTRTTGLVLTAHHQDDSDETLWLKFLRGTHITHLQGMPTVSLLSSSPQEADECSIFTARPLLHVTKKEIVEYLCVNNFVWREDESNQLSKYLRNRVRNELIPLLEDMVGGPNVLHQRLDRLSKQSQEIDNYLTCQAEALLDQSDASEHGGHFVLPPQGKLDVVYKHALVLWTTRWSGGDCAMDYASLERLCSQLADFPDKRQWRINVGGGWDVVRQGDVLHLAKNGSVVSAKATKNHVERTLTWRRVADHDCLDQPSSSLRINLSSDMLARNPVLSLSCVMNIPKLSFTPVWRRGRNPTMLAEFLRGQRVPLHERSTASVVVLKSDDESEQVAVAVYISVKEEWAIDAAFGSKDFDDGATIEIDL